MGQMPGNCKKYIQSLVHTTHFTRGPWCRVFVGARRTRPDSPRTSRMWLHGVGRWHSGSIVSCWHWQWYWSTGSLSLQCLQIIGHLHTETHKHHTHSVLMAILPSEPGLAGFPLNSPLPLIPELSILLGQAYNFPCHS